MNTITRRTLDGLPIPPPYMADVSELSAVPGTCRSCGGPMMHVAWQPRDPAALVGGRRIDYGQVADYLGVLGETGRARPCRRCRLRGELIARTRRPPGTFIDPLQQEIDRLRAEMLASPKAIEEAIDKRDMFSLGDVHITPSAKQVAGRAAGPASDVYDRLLMVGEESINKDFLTRHRRGDFGFAKMPVDFTAEDRARGPLASQAIQNAISVLDGSGTVLSRFPLREWTAEYPWGGRATSARFMSLAIWSELGPEPMTICYSPSSEPIALRLD